MIFVPVKKVSSPDDGAWIFYEWEPLRCDPEIQAGEPVLITDPAIVGVQAYGTWGQGGKVVVNGSLFPGKKFLTPLNDDRGVTAVLVSTDPYVTLGDHPLSISPALVKGDQKTLLVVRLGMLRRR